MLGFVNKLFIFVQLIFFLDHVLLLAESAQKFKIHTVSFQVFCSISVFLSNAYFIAIFFVKLQRSVLSFLISRKKNLLSSARWISSRRQANPGEVSMNSSSLAKIKNKVLNTLPHILAPLEAIMLFHKKYLQLFPS